ncbi:MAG: uracil-DNA glycosylase [Candidatus Moranbacteria bacterium]|nr:uracil-DNA glycosylase [Candidatus Moranbacteria bacterium]
MLEQDFKKLNKRMLSCKKCDLRKTCNQVVPGEGNYKAEIMFIGEGPGKKEDELGRPFVGTAGKFLDEMLVVIKLEREDIYIANVVKCRPPKNRDPLKSEVKTCWYWLEEQIKTIEPKLIVTLGRHSMNRFLPKEKISQAHGNFFQKEIVGLGKLNFYVLYHPAAALYNGGLREILIKDFKGILKVLDKIENEK